MPQQITGGSKGSTATSRPEDTKPRAHTHRITQGDLVRPTRGAARGPLRRLYSFWGGGKPQPGQCLMRTLL